MRKIKTILSKITKPMRPIGPMRLIGLNGHAGLMVCLFLILNFQFSILNCSAQKIGGNVYGGGNKGNVNGKTTVTVKSGDIDRVFGGARMSNVGERTYVYINGKKRDNTETPNQNTETPNQNTNTGNILINQVYGGNDIAGTIGTSTEKPFDMAVDSLNTTDPDEPEASVYATYNTFVHIDSEDTHTETGEGTSKNSSDAVYIGSLYAGGNGDYDYEQSEPDENGKVTHIIKERGGTTAIATRVTDANDVGFQRPELDKTYLEIDGGSIVYAFGGGNNATIRKNTVIHVDNPSEVVNEIYVDGKAQLTSERIAKMGINPGFTYPTSASYQIGSLFGGNNQAAMAIRPTWDLQSGLIRNVYSGGNKGAMTSPVGLLLDVNPTIANPRKPLEINNIYGGCRMADVHPLNPADGSDMASTYIDITDKDENGLRKYNFPVGFAARLLIRSGKIDNVYGGNDIQGKVWGGNAVGIRTSINGNIYGGGNGAYPYTDNSDLATNPVWSDLYYNPGSNSVEALTAIRPHAEQVSIHIIGTQEKPTIIRGNVFCGGNCATLKNDKPEEARVELKLGSYVTAENVFLGNNGAHMVNKEVLKYYKGYVKDKEVSLTKDATNFPYDFSTIDLTEEGQMSKYMDAVAMNLKPKILVDNRQKGDDADYEDYSSWIGSFYCGGNVGSMTYAGPLNMKLNEAVNVYEKVVGGCNNANVPVYYADEGNTNPLNARYEGGIMGSPDERVENGYTDTDGNIKDRLIIDCDKVQIKPMRWKDDTKTELIWNTVTWQDTYTPIASGTTLTPGNTYYEKTTKDKYTAYTADGTETASENEYYEYASETKTYTTIASGTTLTSGNTYFTKNTVTDEYEAFTAVGTETASTENPYYEYAGGYTETGTGEGTGEATTADLSRRLKGGNLYGGCYNSGHVNGNVVINQLNNIIDRQQVFAQVQEDDDRPLYDHDANFKYHITQRNSGVILDEQGMDEMASALSIFGGGYGKDSEIWGSTTINIKRGYSFQIYGGGEQGVIGKPIGTSTEPDGTYDSSTGKYAFNKKCYEYNDKYSTTINLFGEHAGTTRAEDNTIYIAESEFLYAGGFEGPVIGDTHIYLGNGRIFDAFAGGCNADILGHSEAYVGRAWNYYKATPGYDDGFPHIRDYVYGGNDLGGRILGSLEIGNRFQENDKTYRPLSDLKTATYVEYLQGYTSAIFGGGYGGYDYSEPKYAFVPQKPYIHNSVVNFRPKNDTSFSTKSGVRRVFGAGEGASGQRDGDAMQEHSYVHVHIPDGMENFASTEVFGAGNYYGVGMSHYVDPNTDPNTPAGREALEEASAIIDLVGGQIAAAYGGSYNEGITRRTQVNVPQGSTIKIGKIFGGSYGTNALPPCDVYDANVNFASGDAIVTGGIYGGNNNVRRTVYSKVNISSPVISDRTKGYLGTVYGAGYGTFTWSEYTEVNLLPGAHVYEVYGGGQLGQVLNAESIQAYMTSFTHPHSLNELPEHIRVLYDPADFPKWDQMWKDAWTIGTFKNDNVNVNDNNSPPTTYYTPNTEFNNYIDNAATNLSNPLTREAEIDDREPYDATTNPNGPNQPRKYNTNVIIHEGAIVENYAYGGGLGGVNQPNAGDVLGSTYIALLGGNVKKDIYAAGTTGNVYNIYRGNFTASANAYILGGSARNVYGGGWKGSVGFHSGDITTSPATDVPGETHVVIGVHDDNLPSANPKASTDPDYDSDYFFHNGIPAIQRNAYGGGEGGAVYGKAHLTFNNGYVGYEYNPEETDDPKTTDHDERYVEKIEDDTYKVENQFVPNTRLNDAGCLFGGGYIDNSSVDFTNVKVMGGHIRNSVFGGGEIAAIGRGTIEASGASKAIRTLKGLYRPGKTSVEMFSGHVHRNVFGGGRGYNNLGEQGSLYSDGFVFGQTEVHIHGGEIGTAEGLSKGYGNVFGGGDIGYVYSAYENADGTFGKGVKAGRRYNEGLSSTDPEYDFQGYYFKHDWADSGNFVTNTVNVLYQEGDEIPEGKNVGDVKETKTERLFTEDCKVLIEPQCKAIADVTINNQAYTKGQYVPIDDLNTLGNKYDTKWESLDQTGIIIHNAVFAGGNTSPGSVGAYANATSVFGNATASIHDIYNRDMITLGTGHTGGLYGDGNLTFVDGYRELNITNYGTDYYAINKEINIDTYRTLPQREAAYYELRYKCKTECTDWDGTTYKPGGENSKAATLTADEIIALFTRKKADGTLEIKDNILVENTTTHTLVPNSTYWEENGVCSRYAGRLMNSIQRADFCGVFGSRMVMQGAQDRVPETVDYTNYTINRVREVSLNKKKFIETDPETTTNFHGNYFGIYNIVNYLGALTSDVDFGGEDGGGDVRVTDNTDASTYKCAAGEGGKAYETATYYDWKKAFHDERKRNNGNSHNQVALASGVYLELTTEESTGPGLYEKVWGPITGVVELDLINVQTGIGGGFVYAKNVHGVRTPTNRENTTLTTLNHNAVTQWDYEYDPDDGDKKEWQSSGNFVHSTQTIIDDCYNIGGRYLTDGFVPAHYWFIKGQVYVYDQYISAYTGVPNAYSETVDIPLTINAASHGTMKLLDVQPNYYAFYSSPSNQTRIQSGKKIVINDVDYYLNDPISFWDYNMLSASEKAMFVKDTYISIAECKIGEETIKADTVLLPEQYTALLARAPKKQLEDDEQAPYISTVFDTKLQKDVPFESVFRSSNNLGHQTGYILTYNVNNPKEWNTWYTKKSSAAHEKINTDTYTNLSAENKDLYHDGPTYYTETGGLFGQSEYKVGNVINQNVYTTYQSVVSNHETAVTSSHKKQAVFEPAFIVTEEAFTTLNDGHQTPQHLNPGATIAKSLYTTGTEWPDELKNNVAEAYVCTKTIQLSKTEFIYVNTKMTPAEKQAYYDRFNKTGATDAEKQIAEDIKNMIVPAYYCTTEGYYGGNYYEPNVNYRGLEAWSSMSEDDRSHFNFNYDALDLLIDPNFSKDEEGDIVYSEGHKYQYDSAAGTLAGAKANPATYSLLTPVDYSATFKGTEGYNTIQYIKDSEVGKETPEESTANVGTVLTRTEFERLPNEQRHYAPISVPAMEAGTTHNVYVINTAFIRGEVSYAVGQTIDDTEFNGLGSDQDKVTMFTFSNNTEEETSATTYYYCREDYPMGTSIDPITITHTGEINGGISSDNSVRIGTIISETNYNALPNRQKGFTIHGISPTETSTLFVSRNSDIYNLSKEKIITVVYQYDYEESDTKGIHITPVSERHVVNIHIQFKSGVPDIEEITKPKIVLPGATVNLREPNVTPGAYEITGAGWELFETPRDAESHTNGVEYSPMFDPLYWYQNGYYVAYYARTYLGKSYSNSVPLSVANYHDIADVMSDANKAHHMYIDHPNMLRDPKIYLNDYSTLPNTDPRYGKNALDEFKRLFDLSILDESSANVTNGVVTSGDTENPHPLEGHHLLIDDNYRDRALRNLEFFLNTDIDHATKTVPAPTVLDPNATEEVLDPWTPIGGNDIYDNPATTDDDEAMPASGTKGECFDGVFHGDGHTISGLDKSLFAHLCGEVYNLGVTGTFKGAGIADTGYGYIENCWIKSTATVPQETKPQAIFGAPLASGFKQVVNSYYPGSNEGLYDNEHSPAHKVPEKDFYNGEVAYNLNGFYLYKRYNDNISAWGSSPVEYQYWKAGETTPQTGKYSKHEDYCSSGYNGQKYVEDRFADGDFQYASGTIPEGLNERLVMDEEGNPHYYPIWPDDYLFFGQALTYGYVDTRSHQELPSYIWRSGGRLETAENSNRVYRAPAYFRNSDMDVAHFNPYAVFADTWKGNSAIEIYKGMTAIDFSGGNGDLAGGYKLGFVGNNYKHFYQPLLDDDGLTNFRNEGLTKNLLVYTDNAANPSTTASGITANKIKDIVIDPTYTETNSNYKTVAYQQFATLDGHWVQKKAEATNTIWYESVNDHLLADKNDFNAPIAYEFQNTKRMWHQRTPDNYVNRTSGWEAISLPFTADMVTTDTKGEITHFYNGSEKSKNSESKIGHEYWLRELDATKDLTLNTGATETLTANFQYPYAKSSDKDKDVSNTFLWDYYYEAAAGHNRKDANKDTYQEYYKNPRSYLTYARLTGGTPYIIGFPGVIYYEFDLSGQFEARTTYSQPERVKQQVITFVSPTGTTINVSDQELKDMEKTVRYGGAEYVFKPSYLNEALTPYPAEPVGDNTYDVNFALNEAGNSFALVNGTAKSIDAFRPFFTGKKAAAGVREYNFIDFENVTDGTMEPDEDVLGREKGILEIFVRGRNIHTISHLKENISIQIINAAGATLTTYTLEPGKTIITPVTAPGTYIVNKKKLFIK